MSKKPKVVQFTITAVLEFDQYFLDNPDFDAQSLISEMIKVKTGIYENAVTGFITSIKKI